MLEILETNWETAKSLIVEQASGFGQKKSLLRDVANSDRQSSDFKPVIYQIEEILDKKHVLWATRIGKLLGKKRPEGQLAKFLGNTVIDALWGSVEESESD